MTTTTNGKVDLSGVRRPIADAVGLPNAAYTDDAFLEREKERFFRGGWVCVGFGHEVPNAGDAVPKDVFGSPVVLVRNRDGAINAFHNVCSHRGARVLTEPCKAQPTLRCPYHSWAYSHDGELVATPHAGGHNVNSVPEWDKTDLGLRRVRSGTWHDWVFVNLSGDAEPLDDYLAPIKEFVAGYDLGALRVGGRHVFRAKANWKLLIENGAESYHLPWVHPQITTAKKLDDHFDVIGERLIGQGYKSAATKLGAGLPGYPNLPADKEGAAGFVLLFPTFKFVIMQNHLLCLVFTPIAPDETEQSVTYYFVGDGADAAEHQAARDQVYAYFKEIYEQDLAICEEMQRGRYSSGFDGGRFAPAWDAAVLRFHQQVAEALER